MRKSLFLLTLIFASLFSQAQWYWQQLPVHKKNFTQVAAKNYTVAFEYEVTDGGDVLTRVLEFGAQGLPAVLLTRGTNDNGDSTTVEETIFKFDGLGRLIRETTTDKTEGLEWSNVYTYAKSNQLVKKQTVSIDPATTVFTYDTKGKLTKTYMTVRMAAVDKEGNSTGKRIDKPQERALFVYDSKGRLKENNVYNLAYSNESGEPSFRMVFTYNEKHQLTTLKRLNEEGNVYNTENYEYNNDGLLIKAITKTEEEPAKTFVYRYCSSCKQSWKQ